jgi:hypothetical protein
VRPTTSQLSTDEGPDPELVKPADKAKEITTLDEEDTNQDQAEVPATPEVETTTIETANTATFAKFRATGKRNVGRGRRRTNLVEMRKDDTTGPRSISWRTMTPRRSAPLIRRTKRPRTHSTLPNSALATETLTQEPQPFPRNSRVFSKELDDSPHPSS